MTSQSIGVRRFLVFETQCHIIMLTSHAWCSHKILDSGEGTRARAILDFGHSDDVENNSPEKFHRFTLHKYVCRFVRPFLSTTFLWADFLFLRVYFQTATVSLSTTIYGSRAWIIWVTFSITKQNNTLKDLITHNSKLLKHAPFFSILCCASWLKTERTHWYRYITSTDDTHRFWLTVCLWW